MMDMKRDCIESLEGIIRDINLGVLEPTSVSQEEFMHSGIDEDSEITYKFSFNVSNREKQKEASLNILIKYINPNLHDIFTSALKDSRSCRIDSYTLRRGIGKTSTLVYLAIRHDLKLVVSREYIAKQLKEDFPTLKVYARDKAFNTDGLFSPGEIILMDETEKEESDKSVGTMLV
uniref:Virion component n=1 Tax=Staphylococcus phage UHP46 TaxID=3234966 RepID=A0AB39C7V6_9CAUD